MHLVSVTIIYSLIAGFASSAPSIGRGYDGIGGVEALDHHSQQQIEVQRLDSPVYKSPLVDEPRIEDTVRDAIKRDLLLGCGTTTATTTTMTRSPISTPTTTTTKTSSALWTSVNQANCPTVYPTAQPSFDVIPTSCGVSWLDTINMWRRAYNKATFSWSSHLAQVAYGAAFNASGGAKPFKHSDLGYWGSFGEVESPGYVIPTAQLLGVTPFGAAIINWLCEVPSDKQLQASGYSGIDLCTKIQKNIDFIGETPGETGHHDILLGNYAQIGCAFVFNTNNPTGPFAGIYVCDFK